MSELFKADNEYKEWIAGISTDFRRSQIRASMKINDEMLRFYWKLGKGISSMSEQFGYGTRFYKTVSDDLKSILPDVKSFSPTNLKYIRYNREWHRKTKIPLKWIEGAGHNSNTDKPEMINSLIEELLSNIL